AATWHNEKSHECTHALTHTHILHTHTHTHTHTHSHMHTHTCTHTYLQHILLFHLYHSHTHTHTLAPPPLGWNPAKCSRGLLVGTLPSVLGASGLEPCPN